MEFNQGVQQSFLQFALPEMSYRADHLATCNHGKLLSSGHQILLQLLYLRGIMWLIYFPFVLLWLIYIFSLFQILLSNSYAFFVRFCDRVRKFMVDEYSSSYLKRHNSSIKWMYLAFSCVIRFHFATDSFFYWNAYNSTWSLCRFVISFSNAFPTLSTSLTIWVGHDKVAI